MVYKILLIILFSIVATQSQGQRTELTGIIKDGNKALQYVTVDIVGHSISTVTDDDGIFSIKLDKTLNRGDLIIIRATKKGYRPTTKKVAISSLPILVNLIKLPSSNPQPVVRRQRETLIKKSAGQSQIVNVTSNNQTGGITAQEVNIYNKIPSRSLKNQMSHIIAELTKLPKVTYRLHYASYIQEEMDLAVEIDSILHKSKWERIPPITIVAGGSYPKGIVVWAMEEDRSISTFVNLLYQALQNQKVDYVTPPADVTNIFTLFKWPPRELTNGRPGVVITIGGNSANQ